MANEYFHLYMNNPTAGGTDGTQVSEDHAFTAPVSAVLNATNNESKIIKLAARCASGYETLGTTIIAKKYYNGTTEAGTGGNIDKWKFAADLSTPSSCTYTITTNAASGDTIQIGGVVLTAGTDFTVGSTAAETAAAFAAAFNKKNEDFQATVSDAAITVKEIYAGAGNVLSAAVTSGTIVISNGDITASKAADESTMETSGVWADTISFDDVIGAKNVIFWVKVSSTSDEKPHKDNSTEFTSDVTIQAV